MTEAHSILEALGATAQSPVQPASADMFKAGMRRLPGGVTVVTSLGRGGELVGMTATAVCALSADPPTLLVCANRNGSFAMHVGMGAPFSVHLLSAEQIEVARQCAGMGGKRGDERFVGDNWRLNESGVPVLDDALARFDCVATSLVPASTHLLTIGHVTHVQLADKLAPALAYCEGNFVPVPRCAPVAPC